VPWWSERHGSAAPTESSLHRTSASRASVAPGVADSDSEVVFPHGSPGDQSLKLVPVVLISL